MDADPGNGGEAGDLLLFAADKNKSGLGRSWQFKAELARQMELLNKDGINSWITEFRSGMEREQNRYVAMHHPFTMPMEEDYLSGEPRTRARESL